MTKIYQSECDSVFVVEVVNGKVYLSDDMDDSIITINPSKWPEIKEAIDRKISEIDGDCDAKQHNRSR